MTGRSASSGSDSMSSMPSLPWDPRPDSERGLKLTLRQAVGAEAKGAVDALLSCGTYRLPVRCGKAS